MKRRNFSPEFKCESAQLVVDQNYTVAVIIRAGSSGSYCGDTGSGRV
ncbi:transposase [Escherichia coli]|nr:transposase [Escherichia coli]EFB2831055.1 transposase [Escherichia coli]EFC1525859.1 transposase [Escherichia coli]EFC9526389.1 transposase [Escherichia coli]EFN7880897.1 transposase [Escherichia coli]